MTFKPVESYRIAPRIILTERCNLRCPHCFNRKDRNKLEMDYEQFEQFIHIVSPYHRQQGVTRILLMGGEPLLHPEVNRFVDLCVTQYKVTNVFTNGKKLLERLDEYSEWFKYHIQGRLTYTINGYVFKADWFAKIAKKCRLITIHYVINKYDTESVYNEIVSGLRKYPKQLRVCVSADTSVNLFDPKTRDEYRLLWVTQVEKLLSETRNLGMDVRFDHKFPMCFYNRDILDRLKTAGIHLFSKQQCNCCTNEGYVGMVDTHFNLYLCNQSRIPIGSLKHVNGTFKQYPEMLEMIRSSATIKGDLIKDLSPTCKECPAVEQCMTGCYFNAFRSHYEKTSLG